MRTRSCSNGIESLNQREWVHHKDGVNLLSFLNNKDNMKIVTHTFKEQGEEKALIAFMYEEVYESYIHFTMDREHNRPTAIKQFAERVFEVTMDGDTGVQFKCIKSRCKMDYSMVHSNSFTPSWIVNFINK